MPPSLVICRVSRFMVCWSSISLLKLAKKEDTIGGAQWHVQSRCLIKHSRWIFLVWHHGYPQEIPRHRMSPPLPQTDAQSLPRQLAAVVRQILARLLGSQAVNLPHQGVSARLRTDKLANKTHTCSRTALALSSTLIGGCGNPTASASDCPSSVCTHLHQTRQRPLSIQTKGQRTHGSTYPGCIIPTTNLPLNSTLTFFAHQFAAALLMPYATPGMLSTSSVAILPNELVINTNLFPPPLPPATATLSPSCP